MKLVRMCAFTILAFTPTLISSLKAADAQAPQEMADAQATQEIEVEIKLSCPVSAEYNAFSNAIPKGVDDSVSYEEWRDSFVDGMTKLIALVKSGKIEDCTWTASAEDMDSDDMDSDDEDADEEIPSSAPAKPAPKS